MTATTASPTPGPRRLSRWVTGLVGLLVVLALVAIGLAIWEPLSVDRRAAPAPMTHDVRIVRDDHGVPHIFGRTDADVAFGVAYAHSEDDFSTLQDVVAMTRSRLGAISGAEGAKTDFAAKLLDTDGTVARHYDELPADVRALLDGYARGMNLYADRHPEEIRLSKLFPVNGRDIAAGFALRSPFFFGLDSVIGKLVAGEPLPQEGGPALPAPNGSPTGSDADMAGSNAFAISPSRDPQGKTKLISNSHQPWRGGVAWYELVVHSEQGWDFAGATFPGSPYPFLGHNKTLGWTNTVNRPDLIDVYKLVMNDDGTQYRMDGKWLPLEKKRVWLHVRFGPFVLPVPKTVLRSVHGPVIENDKGYFAFRYAGIDTLTQLTQYYRINKAKDFAEWQSAMAIQGVPATNFIYADAAGNIAHFYNAMFPARVAGYDWRRVLPGDTSRNIWHNYLPYSAYPKNINPGSGYLVNSNNTPFVAAGPGDELDPRAFSPLMGIELDMTNRIRRAIDLFEDVDGPVTWPVLWRIKYDTGYSRESYAGAWMKALLALDPRGDRRLAKAQELLAQWDWKLDGKGRGDALALTVLRPAMRKSYNRETPPDAREELTAAADHLATTFATLDPPLGTVLRLRQGPEEGRMKGRPMIDLPFDGGSDTLRAATLWNVDPDGRYSVYHGDSFIMAVEWTRDGKVRSRSIQPFGSATTRPDSPFYTDQAQLFVDHKTKPVYFDAASLKGHVSSDKRVTNAAQ